MTGRPWSRDFVTRVHYRQLDEDTKLVVNRGLYPLCLPSLPSTRARCPRIETLGAARALQCPRHGHAYGPDVGSAGVGMRKGRTYKGRYGKRLCLGVAARVCVRVWVCGRMVGQVGALLLVFVPSATYRQ